MTGEILIACRTVAVQGMSIAMASSAIRAPSSMESDMAKDKQRGSGKSPGDTRGKGGRPGIGQQDQGGDTFQQDGAGGRDTREQDDNIEAVSPPRSRADSSDSPDAGKT